MPSYAAVTSPFMPREVDVPWTLWCSKEPLSLLAGEKQTDRRSVREDESTVQPYCGEPTMQTYAPHTNRYHAVMSRIDHAARKTGHFAAWSS